jgi:hypothetical protein
LQSPLERERRFTFINLSLQAARFADHSGALFPLLFECAAANNLAVDAPQHSQLDALLVQTRRETGRG